MSGLFSWLRRGRKQPEPPEPPVAIAPLFPRRPPDPQPQPPSSPPPAPPPPSPYFVVVSELIQSGLHGPAEAAAAEGLRRGHSPGRLLPLRAVAAEALDQAEAAAAHWSAAIGILPDDPVPPLRAGTLLLRKLNRVDEGDKVLSLAAARFPDDVAIAREHAWAAQLRKDLEEVVRRYARLQTLLPDDPTGLAAQAAGLRDLGRFDEADALMAPALDRFGRDELFLTVHAWIAHYRPDWPEALRRWQRLLEAVPGNRAAAWMSGQILARQFDRFDDAEAVLAAGLRHHPDDPDLGMEQARLSAARGRWEESLRRWTALAERHPDHAGIAAGRAATELQISVNEADRAAAAEGEPSEVAQARSSINMASGQAGQGIEHRTLMLGFESLGLNCEFGLVQRHFGAEPLGLFRWNAIHPKELAEGLEQEFDGIGAPENIQLSTLNGEYIVGENRFRMAMHSFLNVADVKIPEEKLRLQFGRRMRFLRDKLFADMREAEKIFIYQYPSALDDATMARLVAAVHAYGPSTVLFVTDQRPDRPAGHVELVRPGWMVGTIDRLVRTEGWHTISMDAWLALCRNAAALHAAPGGRLPR